MFLPVTPFGTYETLRSFVLAVMAALSVIGYFPLPNGHVQKVNNGIKTTSYVHYINYV